MSLQFNVTASPYNGLIQRVETNVYGDDGLGRISGNTTLLGLWTTRLNLANDRIMSLILDANRGDQYDDSNHTDYPTILEDLVAGQRDYAFTVDENSHLILEIHDVYILDGSIYRKLEVADEKEIPSFYDGQGNTGVATRYGKKATGIFLDLVPAANVTNGLKIEIVRESDRFTTADTTQKPGFAGMYHHYLADYASYEYGLNNDLANVNISAEYIRSQEAEIEEFYSRNSKTETSRAAPAVHSNK